MTDWINTLLTEGRVELPPAVQPAQPAPSGFVAVDPGCDDPADPLAGQIVALQQSLALMLENRRRQAALVHRTAEWDADDWEDAEEAMDDLLARHAPPRDAA